MFAGNIPEPRKVEVIDIEPIALDGPDQILFRPELACLCGSDMLFFDADYPEYAPHVGQSLHEMIGTVVETSGNRFSPGERVLCVPIEHFGFYERFTVSDQRAIPLDDRVAEDEALLAQPLGTVIYGLKKVPSVLDQDVVVVGQGPIGQLFCAALRNAGARRIITIEPLEYRRELSLQMGATASIDPAADDPEQAVAELTDGRMADLVVEAVGHREQQLNACIDVCRKSGTILYFGVPPELLHGIRWRKLFGKNLTLKTSIGPSFTRDFPLAMQWIVEGRVDVKPLITHRFSLSHVQTAFEHYREQKDNSMKVFIDLRNGK